MRPLRGGACPTGAWGLYLAAYLRLLRRPCCILASPPARRRSTQWGPSAAPSAAQVTG